MEPSSLVVIIPFSSRSNNENASLYSKNEEKIFVKFSRLKMKIRDASSLSVEQ